MVNIASGNDLLPNGSMSLPGKGLTYHKESSGINLSYVYYCYIKNEAIDKASLKSSVFILCEQKALFKLACSVFDYVILASFIRAWLAGQAGSVSGNL